MLFKQKMTVHGYFIIANALIFMLISCRYFFYLPEFPSDLLGFSFLVSSIFSHMTLLSLIMGIVLIPFLFLPTQARRLIISAGAALALIALFLDTAVYAQYRFHINLVMLELVMSGQIVSFPLITWITIFVAIAAVWALEYGILYWFERGLPVPKWKIGRKFALLTVVMLLLSNGIHIWAAANVYRPVTVTQRYLPLFYPATSTSMMEKYGWIDHEAVERQKMLSLSENSDFKYPLKALETVAVERPVNIVFIVIDSWRADTFNANNAPNMWQFAQQGKIFNNHVAAGNATRTAIFGLFYGIPGTYWHGALINTQPPVFIDRLQAMKYQLGIFASAKLNNPEFDRTVFAKVPNLRLGSEGNSPAELDQSLTQDWLKWFDQRNKNQPYFSFLFYDAPHGYDFPTNYPHQYNPMLKEVNYLQLSNSTDRQLMMNRYKTSVHYVDSLVKQVIDKIKSSPDFDNTLIIITGDHGQEVNDNLQNFWGHNGNYTDAQVKVPFVVIGPQVKISKMANWNSDFYTSHHDVVPTLMKNFLGVKNNIKDYSIGVDLMAEPVQRDWILASSYSSYAVITPKNILQVGSVGQYDMLDKTNRPLKGQEINSVQLQQALEQISRFNK